MLSLFFFPLEDFTAFNVPPYKTKFKKDLLTRDLSSCETHKLLIFSALEAEKAGTDRSSNARSKTCLLSENANLTSTQYITHTRQRLLEVNSLGKHAE